MVVLHFIFSFISTVTFGVLTDNPKNSLVYCGITGSFGWISYWILRENTYGIGFSNFIAALIIGILSIVFSRVKKMPVTIFNIPSLVSLVPGGPSYKIIREILLNHPSKAMENVSIVIVTAGSLAGGFLITSLIESLLIRKKK